MIAFIKKYKEAIISAVTLVAALIVEYVVSFEGSHYVYLSLYGISYIAVGGPVWIKAIKFIRSGTLFSEFFLMGIATVGAFALGEYAEGVAVMLFYMVGEYAQHGAVHKARNSIKKLIDQQPDIAIVERHGESVEVHPSKIQIGEVIIVKPGGKVPLDGILLSKKASVNAAALTGESKPVQRYEGEEVWAGSINETVPIKMEVISSYKDSKLANILNMVQEATQRKAPTQRFMTKFARVYTPVVVWLAVALTFLPYFFVDEYVFQDWFYKALIFLVVSCPCGLVISIPLGYFGGIGAASQNGILLKGSDYLDQLRKMKTLFMDKTGTLTEGTFEVRQVIAHNGLSEDEIIAYAASLEKHSTHPIGKAILEFKNGKELYESEQQEEISGKGLKGLVAQRRVLVGNQELFKSNQVAIQSIDYSNPDTLVHVAVDGEHEGTIIIADKIKEDSRHAISLLRAKGVERLVMLSGDNEQVATSVGKQLNLDETYGGLLPDEKYKYLEQALGKGKVVGFVGDGVNDAPVITLADVGIAMGGIGSDATVETADVVIQTDQPSKIPLAIDIATFTHRIVWQNIALAMGIKILVMSMAAFGIATMWEAIFADVGVALIAIGNAIRIQRRFSDNQSIFSFFKPSDKQNKTESYSHLCETC
ncbi:MAG: cadmium-translocating P-type ATPase [Balneolaceae bacterium]|nr:cadmium-translocating P-type ATPase [Balneolaceae bacterium]MBO6545145.1 cadmium-translocating P-type ATPase [Balneolaceae bacterium]MBO6646541.1 cadmium-translocating P-type ATPase [Balneolaceae bacterium]